MATTPIDLNSAQYKFRRTVGDGSAQTTTYGLEMSVGGQDYTFIPNSIVSKGLSSGGNQYVFPWFLNKENLAKYGEIGTPVDTADFPETWISDYVKNTVNASTQGVLIPSGSLGFDGEVRTFEDAKGAVVGMGERNGEFVYLQDKGGKFDRYMTANGDIQTITQDPSQRRGGGGGLFGFLDDVIGGISDIVGGAFEGVSDVFSGIDDAVNEIPGGWATVAAVGGGFALANAAAAAAPAAAGAGGNAAALINAGMGGTAAQAASAAANLATTTAGLNAAVAAGGGLVPGVTSNFLSPEVISGAGGATPSATNLGFGGAGQDIPQLRDQLSRTPMPELTSGRPIAGEAVPGSLPELTGEVLTPEVQQLIRDSDALAKANQVAQAAGGFSPAITSGLLGLGEVGSTILKFAKDNPSIAGSLLGAVAGAIGANDAPTSQTATTSIDPQIKQEYLANLERAKTTAAGLEARKFADFSTDYGLAEEQVRNLGLGGKGQKTTDEAARLAGIEAGFTPQQIAAAQTNRANVQDVSGQLGSQFMGNYFNPFEEQVVQGALGDIERTRQMQIQADKDQAIRARAFGGTRQGVVSGMTNEAALRQTATTGGRLRQEGFNQAVQFGQTDAARQFQAQMANQGVSLTLEQANAQLRQQANLANQQAGIAGAGVRQNAIGQMGQLGAQQQNLGLSGANAVMLTQLQRQQLEQQRLDALRNLGTERLAITSGALGLQPANVGQTSTTPLYNNTAGSLLSGGLTGAYIGSLLGGKG